MSGYTKQTSSLSQQTRIYLPYPNPVDQEALRLEIGVAIEWMLSDAPVSNYFS